RAQRAEQRARGAGSQEWYFALTGIDNSNTQFAVLGLWVSRRHGVPADAALRRADAYFRATHYQGTWGYRPTSTVIGRPAMTCAGLLGIAVGAGVVREPKLQTNPDGKTGSGSAPLRDPLKDSLVQVALNSIGEVLGNAPAAGLQQTQAQENDFYLLWSVERVGVAYSLNHIGGRDWYQIGSSL